MNKDIGSEYGQIKIHKKVISQICEMAAKEVKGVKKVGLDCYGVIGKILRLFNLRGIGIKFSEGKEVKVSVPVTIDYNTNAVEVAYEVQRAVTDKLLSTLNLDSLSVDVKVKRIERG